MIKIKFPSDKKTLAALNAGDIVSISGTLYTARDAAHKRFSELIEKGLPLPFDICGQALYYTGPCPAVSGQVIGSCGPTTSARMDPFTPELLDKGLAAVIGKGKRSEEVKNCFKNNKAVYFVAIGGAGAYYSDAVRKTECVCFGDLGTEGVYKLTVEDFKAVVAVDSSGKSIY